MVRTSRCDPVCRWADRTFADARGRLPMHVCRCMFALTHRQDLSRKLGKGPPLATRNADRRNC